MGYFPRFLMPIFVTAATCASFSLAILWGQQGGE